MTATPKPTPEPSSVDEHVQISRRFLEHSKSELRNGDLLQASEKAWGATAHALKAIATQRGWRHNSHYHVGAISEQLSREFERDDLYGHLAMASLMYQNFYENYSGEAAVAYAIDDIELFVAKLDEMRASPPRPFTVANRGDQNRLRHLLGLTDHEIPAIGTHSNVGFSKADPADS